MQREFQDVERHLRDFLAPFAGQRGFFEFAPRFFNGMKTSIAKHNFYLVFIYYFSLQRDTRVNKLLLWNKARELTKLWTAGTKLQFILASHQTYVECFRAVDGETLLAIMEEDKNERNPQLAPRRPQSPFSQFFNIPPGSKSFSKSISIQTTQRPDGVNFHFLQPWKKLICFLFYRFGKLVKLSEMVMETSRWLYQKFLLRVYYHSLCNLILVLTNFSEGSTTDKTTEGQVSLKRFSEVSKSA